MKTKLLLKFPASLTNTPITYDLIKAHDLKLNILKANIDFNLVGTLLFDVEGESKNIADAIKNLEDKGIYVDLLSSTICIDEGKCNECGLCTSVCLVKALSIKSPEFDLKFDSSKCVGCNHCIEVCPSRAISVLAPN